MSSPERVRGCKTKPQWGNLTEALYFPPHREDGLGSSESIRVSV